MKLQNNGQVALVVLLISAVVMTLGLSIAKKTTIDTKVEVDQEQLKQAFNAAESGIEYYLGTGRTQFTATDSQSSAKITVKNIGSGTTINFDEYTLVNKSLQYWLVGHNAAGDIDYGTYYAGGSLSLCVDSSYSGALKVDYFYKSGVDYKTARYGYRYNSDGSNNGGFTEVNPLPPQGGCVTGYRELALTTPLLAGRIPLLLSIKPLISGTKIYLLGSGSNFPVQGIELNSTGHVGNVSTGVGVNRSLSVMKIYQVPGFALDAITSFGSVMSN